MLWNLDPIWSLERLLRKTEYAVNCKRGILWRPYVLYLRYRLKSMQVRLGFSICLNTVGPGLCIHHYGPIIIGRGVKIGSNLRINIGTVIGENKGLENSPTIGDNVVIEAGCKIFGKIQIADGIHVGANSVVNKSFSEPGATIAGVPAKIIRPGPGDHDTG